MNQTGPKITELAWLSLPDVSLKAKEVALGIWTRVHRILVLVLL